MITLYGLNTPNSHKISIALEELALPYQVQCVDVRAGEHLRDSFREIAPNAKIPVITDHDSNTTVFESCAILLYLASKSNRLMPVTPNERWEALQWLFFQASAIGPMFGQLAWFTYYAGEPLPYAIDRYRTEVERLFGVVDQRLAGRDWICGDYSIVDIAHYGWFNCISAMHFDFGRHVHLSRWFDRMSNRPAVVRGVQVPSPLSGWDAAARFG
ncbi:glutathione S-transferase family protein [Rhodoferax ferrireducens]|uniref:glutathione S-transferase family protein n=1 Tax=Rhodoferax ferrireducens TaxID=192843 RepID=UPI0018E59331|nr:glutathione binding-like protein [Rhodoferax ferrireducens]